MGFKCGIVGLPNVGKSTIFNSLTKSQVNAANYPFCTISPNIGMVAVPDKRLENIAIIANSKQVIPTIIEFVDIAGLVQGAAKGEGLGNQFLANIRETDAIAHVVRCFEDQNVVHVSGKVNPQTDIDTINTELILADIETVDKAINKTEKNVKSGNNQAKIDLQNLKEIKNMLNIGIPIRKHNFKEKPKILYHLHLLTAKPVLYIANIGEQDLNNKNKLELITNIAEQENTVVVPICATIESEIAQFTDETEKNTFLQNFGLSESGLDRVIHAGYKLLELQTFLTAGPKEARAWTIKNKTKAQQAAGVIHSDFERGFICAEIISYNDYIKYKGEIGSRNAGKLRLEGKEYLMQDGDIVQFRFNVT